MTTLRSQPEQLCFSIGRPLPVLLDEVHKTSHNAVLREAAAQILQGLRTLELANQTELSEPVTAKVAIHEILTK